MNLAAPRNLSRLLCLAAIGGAAVVTLGLMAMLWHLADRFDAAARVKAQRLVGMGVAALRARNEVTVSDHANWTEAWAAVAAGDIAWLEENIGAHAREGGAMDAVLLAGGPLPAPLGWTHAAQRPAFDDRAALAAVAMDLARRAPYRTGDPPVSTWVRSGDALWLMSVAWVIPRDGRALDAPPALMAGLRRIDAEAVDRLGETLLIDGMTLASAPPDGRDSLALTGPDGPVAHLAWPPPQPGRATLAGLALPLALALGLMLAAVGFGIFAVSRLAERLERALVTSQAADRAKAEFIAMLSHELRTPMNGIVGMLDVLAGTELTDAQAECVRIAIESAETQVQLIDRLLRFGQIEAGGAVLSAAPFQPAELLHQVLVLSRPRAAAKGLSLTLTTQGPTDRMLVGDRLAIRQIAVNLIDNAIKFTEAGAVRVHLAVTPGLAVHRLQLRVQDSGPGIAPADRERIFASFVQAESATTRRHGGVGLGLAISRRLAQAMGGALSLAEGGGPGTTFIFTVPLDTAPARHVPEEAAA